MTKRERAQIIEAIHLIHDQDDYDGGMAILARLVGLETALMRIERKHGPIKSIPITEVARGPNREFKCDL